MTRYIAIPNNRTGTAALPESAGGFSASARADRIEAYRSFALENPSLRPSNQLTAKIEGLPGHRVIAVPDQNTPITGVIIVEGGAEVAEDLQNDLPDYEIIEDFTMELVAPAETGEAFLETGEVDTWHIEAVKLALARTRGFGGSGEGVGVAVLDTGIADVPELEGRISAAFEQDDELNAVETATYDTDGHGTGVAALIGGKTVGVAPGVDILNFIAIPNRSGNYSNFLMASEFIAGKAGISVANFSAGVLGFDTRIKPGIAALLSTYILPVVAVGNNGSSTSRSPGNYAEVFSVGACRRDGKVWSGSSSDEHEFDGSSYAVPSMVAPGHRITTCGGDGVFKVLSGSSLATPIVSGLAALLIERYDDITLEDLRDEIFGACILLENAEAIRQGVGMAQLPLSLYHQGS